MDDELEELLIKKYKVRPEKARQAARQIVTQWAPAPEHPKDRESVSQRTDQMVGLMDSFGAMSSPDTREGYHQRSREISGIRAEAGKYQPYSGGDSAVRFAETMGVVPEVPRTRDEHQRKAGFVESVYPKTAATFEREALARVAADEVNRMRRLDMFAETHDPSQKARLFDIAYGQRGADPELRANYESFMGPAQPRRDAMLQRARARVAEFERGNALQSTYDQMIEKSDSGFRVVPEPAGLNWRGR